MLAFSVLTPYYKEDVLYSLKDLKSTNEDGITTLFYLQRVFPGSLSSRRLLSRHDIYADIIYFDPCVPYNIHPNSAPLQYYVQLADDWRNFKERFSGLDDEDDDFIHRMSRLEVAEKENVAKKKEAGLELCLWASYRGQTLARTVRGMMYYER